MRSTIDDLVATAIVLEAGFEGPRPVIPAKHVAIVTCMDSRIDTFVSSASPRVKATSCATPVVSSPTICCARSCSRSGCFKTREVLLMHHTKCGLHGNRRRRAAGGRSWPKTGAEPPYPFGVFSDLTDAVRQAIERVRNHPFLPHRDRVRGFIYDVQTGHLHEVVV